MLGRRAVCQFATFYKPNVSFTVRLVASLAPKMAKPAQVTPKVEASGKIATAMKVSAEV